MEQTELKGQPTNQPGDMNDAPTIAPPPDSRTKTALSPQAGAGTCATCGAASGSNPNGGETVNFIYAIGTVEPRFPTSAVEKEVAQATGRAETAALTDRQALHSVLSQNRYLARQMCYVLTIEGVETYILQPRDPRDFDLLVDAVRPTPRPTDVDVVIGVRGPVAPPELCNALLVPIVVFDQVYSFTVDSLIAAMPQPPEIAAEQFRETAQQLFMMLMQMADNAGATDEHRAVNYLAVRYPATYAQVAEMHRRNFALTAVEVQPSRLSGLRRIVDVIGAFTNRQTDITEKYFVRVDVTEEFPFLVTKMSPYYERA